jgi:hypothetical protein
MTEGSCLMQFLRYLIVQLRFLLAAHGMLNANRRNSHRRDRFQLTKL